MVWVNITLLCLLTCNIKLSTFFHDLSRDKKAADITQIWFCLFIFNSYWSPHPIISFAMCWGGSIVSFSGPIPPKFEHKLRHHKQSFGKIATAVVWDKDENLLWSGLQRHRSCHSNEMSLLTILLAAVYLGTGNCSSKIVHESL